MSVFEKVEYSAQAILIKKLLPISLHQPTIYFFINQLSNDNVDLSNLIISLISEVVDNQEIVLNEMLELLIEREIVVSQDGFLVLNSVAQKNKSTYKIVKDFKRKYRRIH